MPLREQNNDIPLNYRAPATAAANKPNVSKNEENYDTLVAVFNMLESAQTGLYKEFNAFDVLGDGTDEEKKDKLFRQIAGNQIAFDIITPLLEAMKTAISKVNDDFRKRYE